MLNVRCSPKAGVFPSFRFFRYCSSPGVFRSFCYFSFFLTALALPVSAQEPAPPPLPVLKPMPPPPGMGMLGMAQSPEEDAYQQVSKVMYDAAGLELPFRIPNLRFGAERRFVLQVPVGGIDHLWKDCLGGVAPKTVDIPL